jgi:hypothetical protein
MSMAPSRLPVRRVAGLALPAAPAMLAVARACWSARQDWIAVDERRHLVAGATCRRNVAAHNAAENA